MTRLAAVLPALLVSLAPALADEPAKGNEVLKARARAVLAALVKEDYEAATKDFDATMRKKVTPGELKETWTGLLEKLGPLGKRGEPRLTHEGKYDVVTIRCQFDKAALDARFAFDADGKVTSFLFRTAKSEVKYLAPAYVHADRFKESEVTVGDGKWALPGTLSLPVGDGPFPALVMLHGSGAQDRNESIGPNQPFRDLAGGLASRGIAVLRFEKRTKEHGLKWDKKKDTVKEEVLDDAVAAVALLCKTKGIDPKRVFVLGHSLGGRAAPKVAELDPRVAGLVLLAGLSRDIAQASREQFDYLASLKNLSRKEKEEFDTLRKAALRLKDAEDGADVPASELPFGMPAVYWISLRDLKPVETAAKLRQPILVLQAERDYQVTMADFELWKKGLAGRKDVEFKSYANLNHLFMDGKGKSTPAEYEEPGHVAREVIEDVAAWVKKHAG